MSYNQSGKYLTFTGTSSIWTWSSPPDMNNSAYASDIANASNLPIPVLLKIVQLRLSALESVNPGSVGNAVLDYKQLHH